MNQIMVAARASDICTDAPLPLVQNVPSAQNIALTIIVSSGSILVADLVGSILVLVALT